MRQFSPLPQLLHHLLDQLLGTFHSALNRLQIQSGFQRVPLRGAIDAVLSHQNQGVGQQVQSHGQTAPFGSQHEFKLLQIRAFLVQQAHGYSVQENSAPNAVIKSFDTTSDAA